MEAEAVDARSTLSRLCESADVASGYDYCCSQTQNLKSFQIIQETM